MEEVGSGTESMLRRLFAVLLGLLSLLLVAPAAQAACLNPVACENAIVGNPPNDWNIESPDDTIQGFATEMSVNRGGTISFKVKSETSNYRIDIFRIGYYDGAGARLIAGNIPKSGTALNQPQCLTDASTGLIDCGNWAVSASWTVPSTAVSGVYVANLTRNDTGGQSRIIFVVRDDSSHADIVVQTSDATWQAYNRYGGNSLYQCAAFCPPGEPAGYNAAYAVSYNRPLITEDQSALFTGAEYSLIRFIEQNGYDVSYVSGVDVESRGNLLKNHKLFISSGHDEYWSASQRTAMEEARDSGVSMAFFTGNEGFWKTRYAPSTASGTSVPDRTLISYKDTHFPERQDPVAWTGTWRDPRFTTPSEGVTPENALTGQSFIVNSGTSAITVPYAYKRLRMWRDTEVAALTAGDSLTLADGTLGYEWDEVPDNGFRPAGLFTLSSTTVSGVETFLDFGTTTAFDQTATHNLSMYKAPSGALVFGAGTVQWAWGLSDWNRGNIPVDRNMQQATVNLFADMGVRPSTLIPSLFPATKSTDTTPPTSTINAVSSVTDGTEFTLSGTATDTGGGVVAGVEVSTDDGSTWHPATTSTMSSTWTYRWNVHGSPATTIKVRATDDSGNTQTSYPSRTVTVSCPCSIWGTSVTPPAGTVDSGDTQPIEVGVRFQSDVLGTVSGVRFYKAAANTGTHTGSLWSSTGQQLATATFTGESATGWQTVTFSQPVTIQPNTVYVASYFAPNGHYSATRDYFWRMNSPGPNGGGITDSPPLRAVRSTDSTSVNGVFAYGNGNVFPNGTYKAANYWVDVNFTPTPPPGQVTDVIAAAGGYTSANLTWSAPATGGPPSQYKITPYVGSVAQPTRTVPASGGTLTTITGLTQGTTYTFRVQAVNLNGEGPASAPSNAVTPSGAVAPSAPSAVTARPATNSALVNWTLAASDGDSAITGQTVTAYLGSSAEKSVQVGPAATSLTMTGLTNGSDYTFKVSATNAVGTGAPSASSNTVTPQSTLFDFATPGIVDAGDAWPAEYGVKFKADHAGWITGVRFYKSAANNGIHTGSLWTTDGVRLASATFTNETASGWQTVTFATPVAVTAGTTYVASYFTTSGHPSVNSLGLSSSVDNGPLHTLANAVSPNGVYLYAGASGFPTNTYNALNYWVDVMYALPKPGQVTGVSASEAGRTSANLVWTAPTSGGPVSSYLITPYIGTTAQPTRTVQASAGTLATVTGLTQGTTYTFRVQGVNANGLGALSAPSGPVTPSVPVVPSAPSAVVAQPATSSVRVTWTAAAGDGDSAITGQTVTPYVGGVAQSPVAVGASATTATITGLTNGTAYTFKVSATNGVGTGPQSTASSAVTPQSTLFDFAAPTTIDAGDPWPAEYGVKFTADYDGWVTGVRFYKATTNTGTHTGSLWTADGMLRASATFTNESASGWQSVTFASPVAVSAGTTYVASYFTPTGHPSVTGQGFALALEKGPLQSLSNAVSPNGLYRYTASTAFPTNSYNATNYGVDVMFALPQPGQVTNVTAIEAGRTSANVQWSAPTNGGPTSSYRITPYVGSTPQAATTVPIGDTLATITGLTQGTTYTFRVEALNANGPGPASAASNPVTPQNPVVPSAPTNVSARPATNQIRVSWTLAAGDGDSSITGQTVTPYIGATPQPPMQVGPTTTSLTVPDLANGTNYTFRVSATNSVGTGPQSPPSETVTPQTTLLDFATPAIVDAGDPVPGEYGVKFKSDVDGHVTGVRFYKASTNTGTHVGSLWTTAGTRLASATFTDESASGWQSVKFATPVAVAAGTTYVVSYFTATGHPSVTGQGFASAVDNGPLHTLANAASANGLYRYTTSSAFPTNSYNATNYFVDVLFDYPAPGQVTGVSAAVNANYESADVSWTAPVGGTPTKYKITPYIGSTAQTSTTVNAPATSATLTGLTANATYTFRVQASNPNGSGPESAPSAPVTLRPLDPPSAPQNVTAQGDSKSATVRWTEPSSTGGRAITGYTVTPYVGTAAQTPVTVSGSAREARVTGLTNQTAYTFTVKAENSVGSSVASAATSAVTPRDSIFENAVPPLSDSGDSASVVLGVKFTADVDGSIIGLRFYKAPTNTGTHIGTLWSAGGDVLRQATFAGESASGWQVLTFDTPVAISAGTTYVASYIAPNGHYAITLGAFYAAITNPPLRALSTLAGNNGVFAYSSVPTFPTGTHNASNYWVDVLFAPSAT
jgi:hypothetical protein